MQACGPVLPVLEGMAGGPGTSGETGNVWGNGGGVMARSIIVYTQPG